MTSTRTFTLSAALAFTLAAATSASAQGAVQFVGPDTYLASGNPDGPAAYWSATGDFNGDGRIDLAAADIRSLNNILGFSVAFGRQGGGFDRPVQRSIGAFVRTVRGTDLNHDGRADLVVVTLSGAAVMQGNADGTFSAPAPIFLPMTPMDATLADLNGDGNTDIVFAGDLGYVAALNNGDGTFRRGPLLAETTASYGAVVADFNNDGALDFTGAGGIFGHTYLGNGDGTFQAPIDAGVSAFAGTVSGDFNGDGKIDIAMPSATPRQDGSNYGFKIAMGMGDGTFLSYLGYVLSQQPISNLATGDFNNDGLADIATYVSATGTLRVLVGDRLRWIGAQIYESPFVRSGALLSADVDGNGSNDLVLSNTVDFSVFRSTHGNPPLVAQVSLTPASVIGGISTTGLVQLGDAAPADGAVVSLASSDPLAWFPAGTTVTIPAGASTATFDVATSAVVTATSVTLTAQYNGVSQTVTLALVPAYTLTGFSINPGSQYGIFSVRGTLALSAPADASATVSLSSANPALVSVPASVTVPAGATSVDFTIALSAVSVDTPVTITATRGDVTLTSSVTVLKPADSVAISKAQLTQKISELKIEGTTSSAVTTLTIYNGVTGALLGTIDGTGGKFKGTFTVFVPAGATAPRIVVKSALGGTASVVPQVK